MKKTYNLIESNKGNVSMLKGFYKKMDDHHAFSIFKRISSKQEEVYPTKWIYYSCKNPTDFAVISDLNQKNVKTEASTFFLNSDVFTNGAKNCNDEFVYRNFNSSKSF